MNSELIAHLIKGVVIVFTCVLGGLGIILFVGMLVTFSPLLFLISVLTLFGVGVGYANYTDSR